MSLAEVAPQIAELARLCYARGWASGTSGNFSATVSRDPLRLAITASGVDKGTLTPDYIVEIDGLGRVVTHEHREWLPVFENTQDWAAAAPEVERFLTEHPDAHGFLIRRHGLYTWGRDLAEARRHLEVFEFLFEVMGRKRG